jgi:hypothetical protein
MIKPTDVALWSAVFGSSFETWDWWVGIKYVEGDWDVPGHVRLSILDPDDPEGSPLITANIRMENVRKAFDRAVDEGVINPDCIFDEDDVDLDAVDGDVVLQIATLGEITYA